MSCLLKVISCEVVMGRNLSCSLSAGETPSQSDTLQVPYTASSIFFPNLPIRLGAVSSRESFVGCIKGLAINGKSDRFRYVGEMRECEIVCACVGMCVCVC